MATTTTDDQHLPPKESAVFKQVIKMYENKQYKNALKSCNQILKKFPNHGETLAMKGMALSGIDGKKEEAYDFVKQGLMKSKCKSHVCWHVYGLLNRADKNYEQAIKCYRNALNIDTDNLQILRDLALLQIQRMDTAGLVQTRHKLLELKPSLKANWLGFALAHHLNQSYETALKILDNMDSSLDPPETVYETSELMLYKNMIVLESGDYKGALEHLEKFKDKILDKTSLLEAKAKCYEKLENHPEAAQIYLELIKSQTENRNYILKYAQNSGYPNLSDWNVDLDNGSRDNLTKILLELEEKFPRSSALKRVILDVAYGDIFEKRLVDFVKPFLRKTIPSLFSALKSLYLNPAKVEYMSRIWHEWETSLKSSSKFPGEETEEYPSTYLWLLMLLSAHYYRIEQYDIALKYIKEAIEHTPTVEMLYILQGRIFKHLGQPDEAWQSVEKARLLDTADRYLNTKSTKYLLRCNRVVDADKTISLFTSPGDSPSYNNVVDMQCMWYEIEEGDAYWRLGDVHTALKKWLLVDKHFQDMEEDQFDFHTYILRKFTMRAYIDLLRFERRAHGHKFYQIAAERVVKGYLEIHKLKEEGVDVQSKILKLKEDPPKDERKKKRDDDDDDDETPEKKHNVVVNVEDPLSAAVHFANALTQYSPNKLSSWVLSAELYLKKKKPLIVLQKLLKAKNFIPQSEELKKLAQELYASTSDVHPHVKTVLDEHRKELLN